MKLQASPLSALMSWAGAAALALLVVIPAAAQSEGLIKPFEQLPPQAQQGIQILTTCSAAYGLFAQRVAKDATIAEHYEVSSNNLLKMAAATVGAAAAKRMATHSQVAMLKQSESDTHPGLTIAAATQSCNDIVRSTFVEFFK